nr:S24 family peptidase [uncultured Lichenicoccus sp.]
MHLIRDGSIAVRTILIANDECKPLRHNYRMAFELLLARIDERLKTLGLSERAACIKAGVGLNTIRHIRHRGHAPKPETLAKLAGALKVQPSFLLDVSFEPTPSVPSDQFVPVSLKTIYVKGAVQAGLWTDAVEWDGTDWTPIHIPDDSRFPGIERFGLLVRGRSMDRVYAEGSIVIIVRFADIARDPHPGERVVVVRRSPTGDQYEATIKSYDITEDNRVVLWPQSTDPEYQVPIILPRRTEEVTAGGNDGDQAGYPDLVIMGLVVGSYRIEP